MVIRTFMLKALSLGLGLVFIYNLFFFNFQPIGIGTGIFFLLINLYLIFSAQVKLNDKLLSLGFFALAILFAFLISYRASGIIQLINAIFALILSSTALNLLKSTTPFSFKIPDFLLIPFNNLAGVIGGFISLFSPNTWGGSNIQKHNLSGIIRGLVITIPLLGVLLFLLTQADPVFAKYTFDLLDNVWLRLFSSAFLLVSLLSSSAIKLNQSVQKESLQVKNEGKVFELGLITGTIVVLFAAFILVQFNYLFSGVSENNLHQLGIKTLTYSEYVNKGFFELLIAASISTAVIIYALRFIHNLNPNHKLLIQTISAVLTLEIGAFLLSAAQRINLYQIEHGLTRARILGFAFLIWLALIISLLLINIFVKLNKKTFFTVNFLITIITILAINFINIDGLIATKFKPTVNGEIDYFYLSSLSNDAYPVFEEAVSDAENLVIRLEQDNDLSEDDNRRLTYSRSALGEINLKWIYLESKYKKSNGPLTNKDNEALQKWQSFNYGENLAYQSLANSPILNSIPNLINRMNNINQRVSEQTRQNTQLDRDTTPPLIQSESKPSSH